MKAQPLISICIPTYNGEAFLRQCLESAINQQYRHTEILVVDDGSTDATVQMVNGYAQLDARIKLHINNKNEGLVANWNRCLELAGGEWIKFLFQDDYLHPDCLAKMIAEGENHEFIVCERQYIFSEGMPAALIHAYENHPRIGSVCGVSGSSFVSPEKIMQAVNRHLYINFIGEPTSVMFRKSIVKTTGYFNPLFRQLCDFEYWVRAGMQSGIYYIPEKLAFFRVHDKSMSSLNREDAMHIPDIAALHASYLYSPAYKTFTSSLSFFSKIRIKMLLQVRIHEMKVLSRNSERLKSQMEKIFTVFPAINNHVNFVARGLYRLMMMRRAYKMKSMSAQ